MLYTIELVSASDSSATIRVTSSGKNYYINGFGEGFITNTTRGSFHDVCYTDYWANLVDNCQGENCYLAERYCNGKYIKLELGVNCPKGCQDGACLPEAQVCRELFDKLSTTNEIYQDMF